MMYNNIKRCFCAVIVALGMLTGPLAITSQSLAQTLKLIYVDDSVATSGSGASWNSPRKHLQDALADASIHVNEVNGNEAELRLAQGTYKPDQGTGYTAGDRNHSFVMVKRTRVKGGYAGPGTSNPDENDPAAFVTTLSGDVGSGNADSYTVVKVSDSNIDYATNAVIEGLTISGGFGDSTTDATKRSGAGVRITAGSPRFDRVKITNNVAGELGSGIDDTSFGAGVYINSASPVFTRCAIESNSMKYTFVGFGAGVYNTGSGSLKLINCTIRNNTKPLRGGGVMVHATDAVNHMTMVNCLVEANEAGGPCEQCTFVSGGGICIEGTSTIAPQVSIVNCTIVNNLSLKGGAGVRVIGSSTLTTRTMQNCIVWGNQDNNFPGPQIWVDDGSGSFPQGSLSVLYCDIQERTSGGVDGPITWDSPVSSIESNPLFVSGSFRLQCGSPCIDSANPSMSVIPADDFDLNGNSHTSNERTPDLDLNPRVIDTPDMGAWEVQVTTTCLAADIAPVPCRDGLVNVVDLLYVINSWGQCPAQPTPCFADLNSDGVVNVQDMLAVINGWGGPCPNYTGDPGSPPEEVTDCMQICEGEPDYYGCVAKCLCGLGWNTCDE